MTAEVGVPPDEIVMCGEFLRTEKEMAMAYFEALVQNLLGALRKSTKENITAVQALRQPEFKPHTFISASEICYCFD
jgi:hypothetical protein